MLKRPITFTDFDGVKQTETFYFNLSEPEMIELDVGYGNGLRETIMTIIRTENNKEIVDLFKKLILASYGVRSDDAKRFIKSDELRTEFSQHAAYAVLFMELLDVDKAVEFLKGILPTEMGQAITEADVAAAKMKAAGELPPPPPGVTVAEREVAS